LFAGALVQSLHVQRSELTVTLDTWPELAAPLVSFSVSAMVSVCHHNNQVSSLSMLTVHCLSCELVI
jgi:hypothetical protein